MIGQMTIAIALFGFKDVGSLVTSLFLLMYHCSNRVFAFSEKMKKIYRLEV